MATTATQSLLLLAVVAIEAVKQFIAAGADVNAKDGTGSTALDTAEEAAAELLRKHGGKTAEELKAAGK